MENLIRVIIADDEALIRAGLATILQASGDIEVIGKPAPAKKPSPRRNASNPMWCAWTSACLVAMA